MQRTINFTWSSDRFMEIPRFLWLGATTVAIGILLMLIALQTPPERRDTTRPTRDQQRLYLGTDLGVMVSIDGGRTWMTEETGFRR